MKTRYGILAIWVLLSLGCAANETQVQPDPVNPEQTTDKTLRPGGGEVIAGDKPQACLEPVKRGPCKALLPRFHFDAAAGKCAQFHWGGCDPGANNFQTLEECQAACE